MKQETGFLIILLGAVLILVGLYFSIIQAGLPYQDPTPEMLEHWTNAYHRGQGFLRCGGFVLFIGVAYSLLAAKRK